MDDDFSLSRAGNLLQGALVLVGHTVGSANFVRRLFPLRIALHCGDNKCRYAKR